MLITSPVVALSGMLAFAPAPVMSASPGQPLGSLLGRVVSASHDPAPLIAVGYSHSLAMCSDGTVWAWGRNDYGQLGDGTSTDRSTPVQVSGLSNVTAIAGAGNNSMALRSDGTVWTWGKNSYGQLGLGYTSYMVTSPTQVGTATNWTDIAAGDVHSLALCSDGTVWAWGLNVYGELGDGTTTDRYTPVQVSSLSNVTAIAGEGLHSMALRLDGTVWTWGWNSHGQLGDGTSTDRSTPFHVSLPPSNIPPTASFTYSPSYPTIDNTIQFTDQSTDSDGYIASWSWNFGDGTPTSTLKNPTHKYSSAGTYTATLTVTDSGGLTNSTSESITVENTAVENTTTLSISPPSFTLQSGGSTTLTATLYDNENVALVGKTITWSATAGSVSPSSGTTNSSGQVSVTYTAPSVTAQTSVTVTASFAGDDNYQASSGTSSGTITVAAAPTLENFEDVSDWTWVDNGSNCSGSQSADWWTNGSYSYKIHCYTPGMYGGNYGGIKRAFDLTGVNNITVDILLRQTTDYGTGQAEARVLIGDNVVWSKPYPSGYGSNYYVNTVIDTSGYTGVENLTFRWYCTLNPGWSSGSDITIDYYIDRLRTGVDTTPLTTSISISPSSFTLNSGGSTQLNATLTSGGSPLPDKTSLSWSATSGSITQTGYGSSGTVFTICANYTAPTVTVQTSVTITASFAGDNQYQASSGTSSGTITVENVENVVSTTLSVSPSSFTLQSGGSTTLTATLKDNADNALASNPITWTATSGSVSPPFDNTDSSGQVTVSYTAPTVTSQTTVTVTASFAGDSNYQASSGTSSGTIMPADNVNAPPTASFTYSPTSPTTNSIIQFTDTSTDSDGTIVSWYWYFHDGTSSTLQNPTHRFTSAGEHYVSLDITDDDGASDMENVVVIVTKASATLTVIPSTFTLQPGDSKTLTAMLTSGGSPLAGKTLTWSATSGGLVPSSGTTDSLGQVSVTYAAPSYEDDIVVTVSFAGDSQYQASSGSSTGKVESALPIQAVIEIKPDTLQIGSAGEWVTCYIELPTDNVENIDVSSIQLQGTIRVDPAAPTEIGDYDNDNVPDLTVKFDRSSVENIVTPGLVTLTVTGDVGESTFIGTDKIDVIKVGPAALASVKSEAPGETPEVREEVYNPDLEVTAEAGDNKVTVTVGSEVSTGATIVVNVDNAAVPISRLDELEVLFNNEKIEMADDYEDVTDATDENNPEYIVLLGAEGVQVLVSIPHFSTHTITIGTVAAAATSELPPEEVVTPPAGGTSLVLFAVLGVALTIIIAAALIGLHQARMEATSELIDRGLTDMRIKEIEIFREIRDKKQFTIPELMHEAGVSKTVAWYTVQKLIEKGVVEPTGKVKLPAAGRGKPSTVYRYVGD